MEIRIYRPTDKTKFCAGKLLCKYDRTPVHHQDTEEMKSVVRYDHVFCRYKNQNQFDLFPPEIRMEESRTTWRHAKHYGQTLITAIAKILPTGFRSTTSGKSLSALRLSTIQARAI